MLYVPSTNTAILAPAQRYIHPQTGEVYGGTDYADAAKIAEIGAVPLRIVNAVAGLEIFGHAVEDDELNPGGKKYRPIQIRVEQASTGFDAATWETVDDPNNVGDKLKRPLTTTAWVISANDRVTKNNEVNVETSRRLDILTCTYTSEISAGITEDWTFQAGPASRTNITGVITAISAGIPVPNPFTWRDADNVNRSLTHVQLIELGGTMLVAADAIYLKSWEIKDEIAAITSATDFRAFNVSSDEHWA